jgi:recombination protein RecA
MDSLRDTIASLNKAYGVNVIKTANQLKAIRNVRLFDSPGFDFVSNGGVYVNMFNQFIGMEQCTKTLHATLAVKEWQNTHFAPNGEHFQQVYVKSKLKKAINPKFTELYGDIEPNILNCVWIDAENTFNPLHATSLGVNLEKLIIIKPSSLVEGVDIAKVLLTQSEVGLVVYDSMAAIGHEVEITESAEKNQISINAREWNKTTRAFQGCINRNTNNAVTIILINNMYEKSGFVMGDPVTPANGNGVKLKSYLTVYFKKLTKAVSEKIEGIDTKVGSHIKMSCIKNKGGEMGREVESIFYSATERAGTFDKTRTLLELATTMGHVERKGAIYHLNGEKYKGFEALYTAVSTDDKVMQSLTDLVYSKYK